MGVLDGRVAIVTAGGGPGMGRAISTLLAKEGGDYRQDIALEWRPNPSKGNEKGGVVAPMKHYERIPPNDSLFEKAENSINEKEYPRAITLLRKHS